MAGEAKHTPGPWVADGFAMQDDNLVHVCTTDGSPTYYHSSATICECWVSERDELSQGERFITVSEAEANAHLIAAAPDLLEACQSICGVFEGQDDVPRYVQKARAAIAKATDNQH